MIHPARSSYTHCRTSDGHVVALPARAIQYFQGQFFYCPEGMWVLLGHRVTRYDGMWATSLDCQTLLQAVKMAFVVTPEE